MSDPNVFGLTPAELRAATDGAASDAAFAALQRPWRWQSGRPDLSPKAQRALCSYDCTPAVPEIIQSNDGARKLLFTFDKDRVEAVHMPRAGRVTLCISSQVGCAMGCGFCATASMGFGRQLSAGEIVLQVLGAVSACGPRHPGHVSLVFMGMGEPLHNLTQVLKALEVLGHPLGMGLNPRRITVSTSGLVPQIYRLGEATNRPLLAISLNATTDEQRTALMPVNQRYPLSALRQALADFPLQAKERICVEYVLLAGVNDSVADAQRLAEFGDPFRHHVNLIPFNEHRHASFREPSAEQVTRFAAELRRHRPATLVFVRRSRGREVQGACGQLVLLRNKGDRPQQPLQRSFLGLSERGRDTGAPLREG